MPNPTASPTRRSTSSILREQRAPAPFHRSRKEDIINRGPGIIRVELLKRDDRGQKASGALGVSIDGQRRTIRSGGGIRLHPGESVFLERRVIHSFWSEGFLIDGVR